MRLGDTGIETSALGLGCAQLFTIPDKAARRRVVETAIGSGIVHIDVAPMYGLGSVEAEIGRIVRGRRGDVVLATKFGIEPSRAGKAVSVVQGPLARLGSAQRGGSGDPRAGAVGRLLYRGGYGAADARRSLTRSLRSLGTDHVDLLFVHDPPPGPVGDELRAELEALCAEGLIRAWGVAGPAALAHLDVPVRQAPGDVFSRAAIPAGPVTVLYGVLGAPLRRIASHLRVDGGARARWSDKLGADPRDPAVIAALLVRDAVDDARGGPVLVGTTSPGHAAAAADAAGMPAGPQLDAFRLLLAELAS